MLRGRATLELVVVVVLISSAANAFFGTAEHSSLRTLVRPEQLSDAVARNEARSYATSLAGPPLGGMLFGLSRALPFLADAVTFLVNGVCLLLLRRRLPFRRQHLARSLGGVLAAVDLAHPALGLDDALEAAVGLAIIIALYRVRESLNPDAFTSLKW